MKVVEKILFLLWLSANMGCQSALNSEEKSKPDPGAVDHYGLNVTPSSVSNATTELEPLSIERIEPSEGPTTGFLPISIIGTGFIASDESGRSTEVNLGGALCRDVRMESPHLLRCRLPSGRAAGPITVFARNGNVSTGGYSNLFTYRLGPPPQVSEVVRRNQFGEDVTVFELIGTGFAESWIEDEMIADERSGPELIRVRTGMPDCRVESETLIRCRVNNVNLAYPQRIQIQNPDLQTSPALTLH